MPSTMDRRRRVVIPKAVARELEIRTGDRVTFQRVGDRYVIVKLEDGIDHLAELMDRNPGRTERPLPVTPAEIKGIWRE